MERHYAASFGTSKVMHAIQDGWSYDAIADALTICGRHGPFAVHHNLRSPVAITCKACIRILREAAENIPVVPLDIAMLPQVTPSLKLRTTRQYGTPVTPPPNARQRRAMRNGATRFALM
jgi:hypothetical protein